MLQTDDIDLHAEAIPKEYSDNKKIEIIADHFQAIMETLGLDLSDPSLRETPQRVAKMYVQEAFSGLNMKNFPVMTMFPNNTTETNPQLIFSTTHFTSFCEHHFVPMIGTAYIAYIPGKELLGLSKFSRIVRYFAARPQLQERLTDDIATYLRSLFQHKNIAISIKATHLCVIARGVQDESAETTTMKLDGLFLESEEIRQQFFSLIHGNKPKSSLATNSNFLELYKKEKI